MIQTVSDHMELLHGEARFYYVDTMLNSIDDDINVPTGLDSQFIQISDVKTHIVHHGDIKMFRNKDTPTEIVVLIVVPEKIGQEYEINTDRGSHQIVRKFFRSVVQVLVEGSFRSVIMPIPGWHSHPNWIDTAYRSLSQYRTGA